MSDPRARFFGGGDYTDGLSPSNRKLLLAAFVKGELYDTARDMLDSASREQINIVKDILKPTIGRWDFLLQGHHLWEYFVKQKDGTQLWRTSDHDLAEWLEAPYLGQPGPDMQSAYVVYSFPAGEKGGARPELGLYAVHGQGGGKTFSGPLGQLEGMMRAFTADIYYVAHHHKLVAARAVKLSEATDAETSLVATDSLLVAGGSWLRGYMPNEVTYAEAGLMVPLAMGAPVISAHRRKNGTFKLRVEL